MKYNKERESKSVEWNMVEDTPLYKPYAPTTVKSIAFFLFTKIAQLQLQA